MTSVEVTGTEYDCHEGRGVRESRPYGPCYLRKPLLDSATWAAPLSKANRRKPTSTTVNSTVPVSRSRDRLTEFQACYRCSDVSPSQSVPPPPPDYWRGKNKCCLSLDAVFCARFENRTQGIWRKPLGPLPLNNPTFFLQGSLKGLTGCSSHCLHLC